MGCYCHMTTVSTMAFAVLCMTLFIYSVGFATPYWSHGFTVPTSLPECYQVSQAVNSSEKRISVGLWQCCRSEKPGSKCVDIEMSRSYDGHVWFLVARISASLGECCIAVCTLLFVITRCGGVRGRLLTNSVILTLLGLATAATLVALVVFGISFSGDWYEHSLGYGFNVMIAGGIGLVFSLILYVTELVETNRELYRYKTMLNP